MENPVVYIKAIMAVDFYIGSFFVFLICNKILIKSFKKGRINYFFCCRNEVSGKQRIITVVMVVKVFDFDKTLTEKDTFTSFLFFVGKDKTGLILRKSIYYFFLLIRVLKLISNRTLKIIGLNLFLPDDPELLKVYSKEFADTISLNKNVVKMLNESKENSKVVICSASPTIYIEYLFPGIPVIGLELSKEKEYGIKKLPYKEKKLEYVKQMGIDTIEELYTDSLSDKSLAQIAKKIFVVRRDRVTVYNDYESYKKHFTFFNR